MKTLTIHTDGGARGNPGPAAIGVVFDLEKWQFQHERYIGETTNNVAEYTAVLDALEHIPKIIEEQGALDALTFILDSELVVRQLIGQYRVKEPGLQKLHQAALASLKTLNIPYTFNHVRREQNKIADSLVNHALDIYQAKA